MKSTEFIKEGWAPTQQKDVSYPQMPDEQRQQIMLIKEKCQTFLDEAGGRFMWRGVKASPENFIHKGIRLDDRRPKDTPRRLHNKFNEYFDDAFGAPFRNSMFASGDPDMVDDYGRVYAVFLEGDFDYIWNPAIPDLFGRWQDTYEPRYTGTEDERRATLNQAEEKFMDKYVRAGQYIDYNLKGALQSGNEIMLRGKGYYGINRVFLEAFYEDVTRILHEE